MSDDQGGEVIELRQRTGYRPDLGALAQEQLRQARQSRELDEAEFADLLTPLLGWIVTADLVQTWESTAVPPGDVLVAAGLITHAAGRPTQIQSDTDVIGSLIADRFADLAEVYPTRAEYAASMPARDLFNGAQNIKACGLSLNLICQQYGDNAVRALVEGGTHMRCLFLDPAGAAIKTREAEEGFPTGHLSALTELNIQGLIRRVRDRLDEESRDRLEIATYNETVRFNITIVDNEVCVMQPYLPESRGVDSPTFVVRRRSSGTGLYAIFDQIFDSLWERRRTL
jgi:hypothetical protein